MPNKSLIMLGMAVGSTIGGYVPVLLGADFLSFWGIIGSIIGGLLGIYLAYKATA
ncbi:hypothetical protein M1403_01830 [Patescibacteria group bacterium]|nr:hypothetical protein [Patescibacteria group bacterium]